MMQLGVHYSKYTGVFFKIISKKTQKTGPGFKM